MNAQRGVHEAGNKGGCGVSQDRAQGCFFLHGSRTGDARRMPL